MTDIVERLRSWNKDSYPHNWEAAAEIERLRAALQRLMNQPTMSPLEMTPDQRKELWAAHEEARAALEPMSSGNKPDLRALLPELAVIRQVMKERSGL